MLDREFEYFLSHQAELVREYGGKFLVIVGEEVVGAYDSAEEAYFKAQEEYELGTFLIQQAVPGEEAYSQIFHSRVLLQPDDPE